MKKDTFDYINVIIIIILGVIGLCIGSLGRVPREIFPNISRFAEIVVFVISYFSSLLIILLAMCFAWADNFLEVFNNIKKLMRFLFLIPTIIFKIFKKTDKKQLPG